MEDEARPFLKEQTRTETARLIWTSSEFMSRGADSRRPKRTGPSMCLDANGDGVLSFGGVARGA